jgi:hypothetical protein
MKIAVLTHIESEGPGTLGSSLDSLSAHLRVIRLFEGFEGNLTTTKYAKIESCSQDTALREIGPIRASRRCWSGARQAKNFETVSRWFPDASHYRLFLLYEGEAYDRMEQAPPINDETSGLAGAGGPDGHSLVELRRQSGASAVGCSKG